MTGNQSRGEAREEALALLYQSEITGGSITDVLAGCRVAPGEYAAKIVAGVGEHLGEIDELIGSHLSDWRIERMPVVDRVVARLATYELLDELDVPTAVVLSEAVSLADRYSGGRSRVFLNGVLSAVANQVRL